MQEAWGKCKFYLAGISMVDILFTFRDCNFYNFMFFFSSRKGLLLHLRIYSSVLLFLIIQEMSSTAVQTYASQSHWSMQHVVVSCGSQLFLYNTHLLRFKPGNEFISEIHKVRHLKKKTFVSWKVRQFYVTVLFLPNVWLTWDCELKLVKF